MKKEIYFIAALLFAALYACNDQYDNIGKYATEETVYVGKFSDDPYVTIGYKRVEIELMGDSIGRALSDDIYLGKAKRTVVEYEEADGPRKRVFDSVCSWVNITGLATPKTYIFSIYAEDRYGNRSIPVEALGKPYTDAEFEGIYFPQPRIIQAPTTVEFVWNRISLEEDPMFKFVELIYSYTDANNRMVSGKLNMSAAGNDRSFSVKNLNFADSTSVVVNCRIIPRWESSLILDTLPLVMAFATKTSTAAEYVAARAMRPITSALIDPSQPDNATIVLGSKTDHLVSTDIRYKKSDGSWAEVTNIGNDTYDVPCSDIKHGEKFQIRCTYQPPETAGIGPFSSEWTDGDVFILKHNMADWVVAPRYGSKGGWDDGRGSQDRWTGGHPMLMLDDDPASGWHSLEQAPTFPQVLVIDMKEEKRILKVLAQGAYWKTVQLYLTNDLSISGYETHDVDWYEGNRETLYNAWTSRWTGKIPAGVPASWGALVAQRTMEANESSFDITLTPIRTGRFLILRFPDNAGPATYIVVHGVQAYSD